MRRNIATVVIVVLVLIGYISPSVRNSAAEIVPFEILGITDPNKPLSSRIQGPIEEGIWTVVHVVDGDTIDVGDNQFRLHVIRHCIANHLTRKQINDRNEI
jgi:endonuclease YncB( thermonuclease family)